MKVNSMQFTVALAQIDASSLDPKKNLEKVERYIKEAKEKEASCVIFPELFTTGLRWDLLGPYKKIARELAEEFASYAKKYSIHLMGSLPFFQDGATLTNNFRVISPAGQCIASYSKIHLISLLGEGQAFSAGKKLEVTELNIQGARFSAGFAICYDIRFCEMFTQYGIKGCDVTFICSAFPKIRMDQKKVLETARAIENQMFVVSVNRVGCEEIPDIGQSLYGGESMIIDPLGRIEKKASPDKEELVVHCIDLSKVKNTREKFHTLSDRKQSCYYI